MLRDSVVVAAVVVRTRPRAIPLAMITMRNFIDGFPFLSHMYGAPFGGPELRYQKGSTIYFRVKLQSRCGFV